MFKKKDISEIDVETMSYVENTENILVYRKIKKLEIRSPATKKLIPWFNDKGNIELAVRFNVNGMPSIVLMKAAYTIASMVGGKIKWPNDVILNGKKLCGMILRMSEDGMGIFGMGLNLNREKFNEEIKDKATSYFIEYGKKWNPEEFIEEFIEKFNVNLKIVTLKDLEDAQIFKGKTMNIEGKSYLFKSLNKDGTANWEIDGKEETFASFEISFTKHYHLFKY